MSPRHGGPGGRPPFRVQLPAAAPISLFRPRTSLCSRVSKTQLAWGSTRAACQFSWGRGRQVMHLLRKQAHVGAVPIDSTISLRGTRLKHREEPHKLLQVGVIPTPATSLNPKAGFRRNLPNEIRTSAFGLLSDFVIRISDFSSGRCSGCRSVKPVSKTIVGSDDWSITSTSHHLSSRS